MCVTVIIYRSLRIPEQPMAPKSSKSLVFNWRSNRKRTRGADGSQELKIISFQIKNLIGNVPEQPMAPKSSKSLVFDLKFDRKRTRGADGSQELKIISFFN